jgi:hypothetical protein
MRKGINDIVGQKYGELTVESYSHKDSASKNYFICICSCGKSKSIQQSNLLSGRSSSCGCSRRPAATSRAVAHDVQHIRDTTLTEHVSVDIGLLVVLTRYQLNSMSTIEMEDFRMANKAYLIELDHVMEGDRVVIKENGMCATANINVTYDCCFDVTLDDGGTALIFCLDDIWKLVHVG